jgi:hypothetical protein
VFLMLLKNRNWLREQDLNLRPFADNKSEPEGDCVFDVTEESELVAGAGFEPTTFRGY